MQRFGAITGRIYGWLNRGSASNQIVVDLADLQPTDRALEVGCGPGTAVALAAERIGADRVAAIDPSDTFVDMVKKRVPGADVRVGTAEQPPFEDASFSVIWSIAAMHHWVDRDAGLAALNATLAPGGRLLLAERLLRRPGHGITNQQVSEVTQVLGGLGYGSVETLTRPNGRKTIMVIRAVRSDG
ncbi:class I SAM-dependent methyltransferase [Phytoactinopolyspora limicola]|uniref:class I SAM-dependent methyltransferase n=1 Tax=Phytoactinopolyspora limicola TaxID=2715536 RepID=UPI0014078E2D|nr:class I SAM-dependent methyltransferase [Phytoactinopolyspora limicola]